MQALQAQLQTLSDAFRALQGLIDASQHDGESVSHPRGTEEITGAETALAAKEQAAAKEALRKLDFALSLEILQHPANDTVLSKLEGARQNYIGCKDAAEDNALELAQTAYNSLMLISEATGDVQGVHKV